MTKVRLLLAAWIAMAGALLATSALASSQSGDRQEIERWEREADEFEEYRSFRDQFEKHGAITPYPSDSDTERFGKAAFDQEQTPLTTLKNVAIKTVKIAGEVVRVIAGIVVFTAIFAGYVIASGYGATYRITQYVQ